MFVASLILGLFFVAFFIGWILALRRMLGFREGHTCTVYAQLTDEKVEKNVNQSQCGEWNHKRTTATYSYTVNDIRYSHKCVVYDRLKSMPSSIKLIYQKKCPKAAYIPEFEPNMEKGYCLFLFVGMFIFGVFAIASLILS